ncbi:carbohydrate ABC transporter permease [Deinococcus roseus]|uniref:ABC transporter permease n=1 Tax=Deinococcus roseus TaxID=392414 RepID=A0ABQ2D9P9_9DEIO|nr:sugar ABC transporter permease [Deinococcus roseus]GGJ48493.1 ABC transporter permease [Deinococcus roseus]
MTKSQPALQRRKPGGVLAVRARTAVWFLVPALLIIVLVAGYPLFKTISYSFTNASLVDPSIAENIGIGNYWYKTDDGQIGGILVDPKWWQSVGNTVLFAVASVFLEFVFGLGIAYVLNMKFPGQSLMRTAMLVPWAIPTVVSAQMWYFMYNDTFGLIGQGMGAGAVLADSSKVIWAIIAVDVWKTTPFMALLLLAGMQGISADIYEAANVDGASKWTQFWRITLPLLKPTAMIALIFRTLDALRVFDVMAVMLGTNKAAETSMTAFARRSMIDYQNLGEGSGVSVLIFLIILAITILYVTTLRVRFD